jgi:hypothetical protein
VRRIVLLHLLLLGVGRLLKRHRAQRRRLDRVSVLLCLHLLLLVLLHDRLMLHLRLLELLVSTLIPTLLRGDRWRGRRGRGELSRRARVAHCVGRVRRFCLRCPCSIILGPAEAFQGINYR